jgi:hypothetical protein
MRRLYGSRRAKSDEKDALAIARSRYARASGSRRFRMIRAHAI